MIWTIVSDIFLNQSYKIMPKRQQLQKTLTRFYPKRPSKYEQANLVRQSLSNKTPELQLAYPRPNPSPKTLDGKQICRPFRMVWAISLLPSPYMIPWSST
jgi:hypothetical protein